MSEFTFRNLSIKVFPTAANELVCQDGVTRVEVCHPCTNLCTGTYTPCDETHCTLTESIPIVMGPYCNGPGTSPGYVDTTTNIILPAGDAASELAALRQSLQVAMSAVDAAEQQLQSDEGLSATSGIDRLRGQLMDAVAELDEYRGQIE